MRGPPRLAVRILRALAPRELADPLEGDLAEGWRRRREGGWLRAAAWCWLQVLTVPYPTLHGRMRRLRRGRGAGTTRDTGGGGMRMWTMDLRLALRTLRLRPGFAGLVVPTLALSIGAATLLFSVMEGVLLRPLPYQNPEELVSLYLKNERWRESSNHLLRANWDSYNLRLGHAEAWRDAPVGLQGLGAFTYRFPDLAVGEEVESVHAMMVDEGVFPVLGVSPAMGRLPTPEELATGAQVAVVSHGLWSRLFGGDPDAVGESFRLDDGSYTLIGVMPRGFYFPDESWDLWMPILPFARGWPSFYGIGRLAPGATVADASEGLERVARRLGEENPLYAGFGARAVPHLDNVVERARGGIWLLFATALVVVLVACVNVANLTLARSAGRRGELAVRTALGASGGSLVRTVFAEVLLVCLVGGGLGIALATVLVDPFVGALSVAADGLPRVGEIGLNFPVLLFALGSTVATAAVAGIAPAVRAAGRAPAEALSRDRGSSRGRGRRGGSRWLLAVQGGLAAVLLIGAGLLGRSFLVMSTLDPGYDPSRAAFLSVEIDRSGEDRGGHAMTDVRIALGDLPGAEAVGFASSLPERGGLGFRKLRLPGQPEEDAGLVATVRVGGAYFRALGLPLLSGREPRSAPGDGPREAAISESLAATLFPPGEPLGQRLLQEAGSEWTELEVVGVVAESRQLSVLQEPVPMVFPALGPSPPPTLAVLVGGSGDPSRLVESARATVIQAAPGARVSSAGTLRSAIDGNLRHLRIRTLLMGGLAGLAGLLAMVGVAGVVAQFLAGQTREVGVRMALGARARREVARVVLHALGPTALGVAGGVGVAAAISRVMEGFLYELPATDAVAYAAAAGCLLLMAGLAAWIPARRTAAVDPARVLHEG